MRKLHFKHAANLHFGPDVTPSDFLLSGWFKGQLASRLVAEINKFFEIV
jgi:hypothetical protein